MKIVAGKRKSLRTTLVLALSLAVAALAYSAWTAFQADPDDGGRFAETDRVAADAAPVVGAAMAAKKNRSMSSLLEAAKRRQQVAAEQRRTDLDSNRPLHPFPNMPKSRRGLDLEGDPFAPISQADQDWLDRNGYPNAMQWQEYQTANAAVLEQAAAAGDKVAETYLDVLKVRNGDREAEASLFYSGALGNTFAIEMLAAEFAGSGNNADPSEAYALSRVLEMRGLLGHGNRHSFYATQQDPLQQIEAEARAVQYYNLLVNIQREVQGPNAVVFDLRPSQGGG